MSALQIYDLYRALYSFKSIQTTFRGEQVKLLEISKPNLELSDDHAAGHIKFSWKCKKLVVSCYDGSVIKVSKLIIGKKALSASDFNNGFLKNKLHEHKFE